MERVISSERRPIKMWLNDIEDGALEQAKNLANLPFIHKWVAIMPDSHQGYGMPIGGVIATDGVVIPNAVGVDIGCGMSVVELPLTVEELEQDIEYIVDEIRNVVPVGFNHHGDPQEQMWMPEVRIDCLPIVQREFDKAHYQIGTLGGGNHFIELQSDVDGKVYLMIHSGSRNIGYQVAKYYNELAKDLNDKWYTSVPSDWDLAFLPIGTKEAKDYINEMKYCVEFAKCNRILMMYNIMDVFDFVYKGEGKFFSDYQSVNIAHNYASLENHFGKNVWVHRKGATSAKEGELGIIPGSQGTQSYIVRGLGNKDSFMSCSHGAGRVMGRKQAKKELNLEEEQRKLDEQGIIHSIRSVGDLDEATGAYKDINVVMDNQKDLVEIVKELRPLAVVKG